MVDDPHGAYLDHQAGPHILPPVRRAMEQALDPTGDPDALHEWGRAPAAAVERAREAVARLVAARPEEIIFTSGAVESRNLAVKGTLAARARDGGHVVASMMEHPATLSACRSATRRTGGLSLVTVGPTGSVAPADLREAVREDSVLVCLTHAQAEIGTVADLGPLITAARSAGARPAVHVDAALTTGLLDVDVTRLGADLVTIGAGPLGAPLWTGALWVSPETRLHPLIEGGDQESGKRAGHVNLPGVVGLGVAAELAARERTDRVRVLRERTAQLVRGLLAVDGVRLNGPPVEERLPGHVQVSVAGADSESLTLMLAVRGVAASPGSACTGAGKSSPVLEAIGLEAPWVHSAVLFTLGPTTTGDEIETTITAFSDAVRTLREMGVHG